MNLDKKCVPLRSGKKRDSANDDAWNSDVWLLVKRLAIMQACLLVVWVAPVLAQHEGHEQHEVVGWVPQDILERPLPLRRDIGNLHEKVTTSSAEAQAFYDQGLGYLHSYVWIEAARSFHQALRLDGNLAMAYVGLSYAEWQVNRPAGARAALARARELAAHASTREQRRIALRVQELDATEQAQDAARLTEY